MAELTITAVESDLYSTFVSDLTLGEIRPGERLTEEGLAERWHVGRVPVREALLRLAQDGIVRRRGRSGTYVHEIDARELRELYGIRIGIEPMVAAEAARAASDGELDDLVRLAAESDAVAEPGPKLVSRDHRFHMEICRLSGLSYAARVVELTRLQLLCVGLHHRSLLLGRYTISEPDHRPIADALRRRDAERAASMMAKHLRAARDATMKDLDQMGIKFTEMESLVRECLATNRGDAR